MLAFFVAEALTLDRILGDGDGGAGVGVDGDCFLNFGGVEEDVEGDGGGGGGFIVRSGEGEGDCALGGDGCCETEDGERKEGEVEMELHG